MDSPANVSTCLQQSDQWDEYWDTKNATNHIYGRIASFYRRVIIAPSVRKVVQRELAPGSRALHLGAGAGEIDSLLPAEWNLVAIDFSAEAIRLRQKRLRTSGACGSAIQADLFELPFIKSSFGVVFNLGVMEHFTDDEVLASFSEIKRVLEPTGRAVFYWPPVWGPTVIVLHSIARCLRLFNRSAAQLHPPEINLFRSPRRCRRLLSRAGLRATSISYGPRDLFTHVIVIATHAS